ncbi:hypothetical protein ALI22I_03180 [Saccharothrix sp. ALI-22-I]|uniref:hypothetical protein n=1 Tax=Saccharothrix sp. ALI-22-I TaxID=1933778 RepID=UPI00097BC05A|nr:hypothetical protein [Saccharothrix sp. ALI-22-I]ONI92600.1 hypothetical protein ALI22I_03180 [Saccharothrix sp. ALI-22-I]
MNTSDLSACELYALHWDERGNAVTASLEGPLDEASRQTWNAPPDHDWIRLHLRFDEISDLDVSSWSHHSPIRVDQIRTGDRVSVTVTGEGTNVRFTATAATLVTHRTSRTGSL